MIRFLFRTIRFLLRPRTWIAGALGAAAAYFYDPDRGRSRRARAKDQLKARARRAGQQAEGEARYLAGQAEGRLHDVKPGVATTTPDDAALRATIESTVLRGDRYPKGDVNVEVSDGVVTLRGQVDADQQRADLVGEVSALAGVRTVVDHLHLPGEVAANKEPSLQTGGEGRSFG